MQAPIKQACVLCGCTDDDCSACIQDTGQPCYWVRPQHCSACFATVERREFRPGEQKLVLTARGAEILLGQL